MRPYRAKVEVFVRLDLHLVSSRLEGVLDDEEIESLEVLDVNIIPGVSAFTDVRHFFTAQSGPIYHNND